MARSGTDFDACIEALSKASLASDISLGKVAKDLKKEVEKAREKYRKFAPDTPEAELNTKAHEMAIQELQGRFKEIRNDEVINIKARMKLSDDMGPKSLIEGKSKSAKLRTIMEGVEGAKNGILASITNGPMEKFLSKFEGLPFGIDRLFHPDNPLLLKDLVRSMYGEGNVHKFAKEMGETLRETYRGFEQALAKMGVEVKWDLDNFVFPQIYNYVKVAKATRDDFINDFLPRLDIDYLNNHRNADYLQTDEQVKEYLGIVYDDMLLEHRGSDGVALTKKSLTEQLRTENRKFKFNTADDYLYIHEKYGDGNVYSNVVDHLTNLSEKMAMIQRFGTDPGANFRYALSQARQDMKVRKNEGRGIEAISDPAADLEKQWAVLVGQTNKLVGGKGNKRLAETMATFKNLAGMKVLGRVLLASVGDLPNIQAEAELLGLGFKRTFGNLFKTVFNEMKDTVGQGSDHMKFRRRASTALESLGTFYRQQGRFSEQTSYGKLSKTTGAGVDALMRMTFAIGWQRALKESFHYLVSHEIADMAVVPWNRIEPKMRMAMESLGLTDKDWIHISSSVSDYLEDGKVVDSIIDPQKLLKRSPDAFIKYQAFIREVGRRAVREPSIETRAIMTQGLPAGNVAKEAFAPLLHLKSFAITQTLDGLRTLLFDKRITNRYTFGVRLAILMWSTGALVDSLYKLSDNKKLPSVTSPEFFTNGLARAAFLGVGGDVVSLAKFTNWDKGHWNGKAEMAKQLMGPTLGLLAETGYVAGSLIKNHDKAAVSDAINFLDDNKPGNNIWYKRVLGKHNLFDTLREWQDPQHARKMKAARKRMEDRAKRAK